MEGKENVLSKKKEIAGTFAGSEVKWEKPEGKLPRKIKTEGSPSKEGSAKKKGGKSSGQNFFLPDRGSSKMGVCRLKREGGETQIKDGIQKAGWSHAPKIFPDRHDTKGGITRN